MDKKEFEIIMEQANGNIVTALENQILSWRKIMKVKDWIKYISYL